MPNVNTDRSGFYIRCEECGEEVGAVITHNGVCAVGHYVHCGWGHEVDPAALVRDREEATRG